MPLGSPACRASGSNKWQLTQSPSDGELQARAGGVRGEAAREEPL